MSVSGWQGLVKCLLRELRRRIYQTSIEPLEPRLRALARYTCRNQSDAEDALQETLARALQRVPIDRNAKHSAWCACVLSNVIHDYWKLRTRESPTEPDHIPQFTHEDSFSKKEITSAQLRRALDELTPRQRDVVNDRLDGKSMEEIAKNRGFKLGTAFSCYHRAIEALRWWLGSDKPIGPTRTR